MSWTNVGKDLFLPKTGERCQMSSKGRARYNSYNKLRKEKDLSSQGTIFYSKIKLEIFKRISLLVLCFRKLFVINYTDGESVSLVVTPGKRHGGVKVILPRRQDCLFAFSEL